MKQLICICNRVTYDDIEKILQQYPHAEIEEIMHLSSAGTTCGRCRRELTAKVEEIKKLLFDRKKPQQLTIPFQYYK